MRWIFAYKPSRDYHFIIEGSIAAYGWGLEAAFCRAGVVGGAGGRICVDGGPFYEHGVKGQTGQFPVARFREERARFNGTSGRLSQKRQNGKNASDTF